MIRLFAIKVVVTRKLLILLMIVLLPIQLSAQDYGPLPDPHLTQFYAESGLKNLSTTFRFEKFQQKDYPPMYIMTFYIRNKEWLPPLQNHDIYLVDASNDTTCLRSIFPGKGRKWVGYPWGFSTIYNAAVYAYYVCGVVSIIDDIDEFLSHNYVYYNIGNGFREYDMREDHQKFIKKFNKRLKVAAKRAQLVDDSTLFPYYTEFLYRIGELKDE